MGKGKHPTNGYFLRVDEMRISIGGQIKQTMGSFKILITSCSRRKENQLITSEDKISIHVETCNIFFDKKNWQECIYDLADSIC